MSRSRQQNHDRGRCILLRLELAALLKCVSSLFAIIIVASTRHGKPLPTYPLGITFNAAVAIFSTILKTTMLYCAAEAISQSKWIWFYRQPQRLADMEMYDQASRGPWGSLVMIARIRWRYVITYVSRLH